MLKEWGGGGGGGEGRAAPLYGLYGYVPVNRVWFFTSLSRVIKLRNFFRPKEGQGFKPSAAHLYPNIGRFPLPSPPPPGE